MWLLRLVVPAAVAGLVIVAANARARPLRAAAPAPQPAVVVAKRHVAERWGLGGFRDVFSVRSERNPRWALVNGFYALPKRPGGPRPWAVWLRLRDTTWRGAWRVMYAGKDAKAAEPGGPVPCDIRPAFSEPSC